MTNDSNRPLILLSNDDGVEAKGLKKLVEFIRPLADLVVMAPDRGRSGAGLSITSTEPVRCTTVLREEGLHVMACSGTPTDCIKLALYLMQPHRLPSMVVSGINHGDNASVNVHYSGTMGAALEGCIRGIPSVGFSLCNHDPAADFSMCEVPVRQIVQQVLQEGLPAGCCLNVNIPDAPVLKGMKLCRQTAARWLQEWIPLPAEGAAQCYRLTGTFCNLEPQAPDTDRYALQQHCVSITPIAVDMTAHAAVPQLRNKLSNLLS